MSLNKYSQIKSKDCTPFKILVQNGGILLDVRTHHEFAGAHVTNSINIPLEELKLLIDDIKSWNKPIVTCSVYGQRSKKAADLLHSYEIEAYDGGYWEEFL